MAVDRAFYVTQGSLGVWSPVHGMPERVAVFADDDEGLHEFDVYLAQFPEQASALLVDVIEEEFAMETIPELGLRDRKSLITRRRQRKYRRTPYSLSQFQGKAGQSGDEFHVLHSAISNHELLDPWLQVILRHQTPLSGVYSVPLMAPGVFKKLFRPDGPALFIARHQGNKLRQVFIRDGHLNSARLSQSPGIDQDGYAQFIVTEAQRSRRYLERIRLLSSMETLEVCVVADEESAGRIERLAEGELATQFQFIDSGIATGKLLGDKDVPCDRFETVYLAALFRKHQKHSYANSGENRYWFMQRLRQAIVGTSTTIAVACTAFAAFYFSDAWMLQSRVDEIQRQVTQLTETFRREHEKFNPIQAGSHEMKLAVDTGDYILRNRLPVPWVMNQVGTVLGDYPEMQVRELKWLAETPPSPNQAPQRRSNRQMPVAITEVNEVGAILTADITPFDGDMRKAFARIDQLAADLQTRTSFSRAITVEYPLNASTSAAVSGEIGVAPSEFARFRIRVTYDVPGANSTEVNDERT